MNITLSGIKQVIVNYRHIYHAGSFTDVVKHITLIALLEAMKRKDKSFCFMDTHAGSGFYDLSSQFALKTKEYVGGIEKIIAAPNPPTLVRTYLDCVHRVNNALTKSHFSSLTYYPGSPYFAKLILRGQDSLILCELEQTEYNKLRTAFADDHRIATHHTDGYQALKAFLPPPARRGMILIDPPYENPDEFTHIAQTLSSAVKRFESGVFAIWYPIKELGQVKRFHHTLTQHLKTPILALELTIYPDLPNHLNGCGMVIVNPPYQIEDTLKETLPWVWNALTINQQGHHHLAFLQ